MYISVNLAGMPVVTKDDVEIRFATKKAEAIFYYLVLNKKASKALLESMFWSNLDSVHANKNLRNSIYYINKAMGCDVFKKSRGVLEFADSLQIIDKTDPFSGDFMESFYLKDSPEFQLYLDDYAKEQSARLYNTAKDKYINSLTDDTTADESVVERYLRLSKINPYDEETALATMEYFFRSKQLDNLIKIYKELEKSLRCDLMIEPLKVIQNLYQTALMQKKVGGKTSKEIFFGRQSELERFDCAHRNFSDGQYHTNLIISGSIGSGKTHLLNHYLQECDVKGTIVVLLTCYEAEQTVQYKSLSLLIGKMLKALKKEKLNLPESSQYLLECFFPFVLSNFTGGLEVEALYNKTKLSFLELEDSFEEISSLLFNSARFVVVIDDLDYCDKMSLDFIQKKMVSHHGHEALFILTCHKNKLTECIGSIANEAFQNFDIIELQNFNKGEIKNIAYELLKRDDPSLIESLCQESSGNPLYLFEIINNLRDNKQAKSFKFFCLLENKLKTLSDSEQTVLKIASLFIGDIIPEAIAAILGVDFIKVLEFLDPLVQSGFLKEEVQRNQLKLLFVHEQFRRYIYENQPVMKRKALHFKIAAHLAGQAKEQDSNDRIDNIIYHYSQGGQTIKSLQYKLKKASNIISINRDFPEFLAPVTQSFIDELANEFHENRVPLELLFEFTLLKAGFAIKTCKYREGLEYANYILEFDTENFRRRMAHKQLICYGIQTRDYLVIKDNAVKALQLLKTAPNNLEKAELLKSFALAEINMKHYKNAKKVLLMGLNILNREPSSEAVLYCKACIFNYLAYEYKYLGEYEKCLPFYHKAVQICNSANIINGLPLFYMNLGQSLMKMGRVAEARDYFLKFENMHGKIHSALSTSIVKAYLALIYFNDGDYLISKQYMQEALDCSDMIKNPYEDAYIYKVAAFIKRSSKDPNQTSLPAEESFYFNKAVQSFKVVGLEREIEEMKSWPPRAAL